MSEFLHYQGVFWIIANSIKDIENENFKIESVKFLCDKNGKYFDTDEKKAKYSHKKFWEMQVGKNHKNNNQNLPFNFFPRGRVGVFNEIAYLNLYFDSEKIRNKVVKEFNLSGLKIIFKPEPYKKKQPLRLFVKLKLFYVQSCLIKMTLKKNQSHFFIANFTKILNLKILKN